MTVENRRAKQVWRRMTQIYGARFQEQFGKEPSNAWADAIEDMPDEKLSFGLRKITREHPIHPPPLGAFVQACNDMPVAQQDDHKGPSIQEIMVAYVSVTLYNRLTDRQFRGPWTFLYRTGIDPEKPKQHQRTAECTGLVIEPDGEHAGHRIMVVDMHMDVEGHNRAMRSFEPGARPRRLPAAPDLSLP